jgi:hypothetical protein
LFLSEYIGTAKSYFLATVLLVWGGFELLI